MPSKLPRFTIRAERDIIEKIGYIAVQNDRSTTQEIVHLIKNEIKRYEQENGEIEIPKGDDE